MRLNHQGRDVKWERTIAKGSLVMHGPYLCRVESVETIGYGRYVRLTELGHDVLLSGDICVVKLREPRKV